MKSILLPLLTSKKKIKLTVPGSKSYTNRALIIASLCSEGGVIESPLYSDDTYVMIECLKTLGVNIKTTKRKIFVSGGLLSIQDKKYDLFVSESGTTARFLLAACTVIPGVKTLRGGSRLSKRPISDLVGALKDLGANIQYLEKIGCFPIEVNSTSIAHNRVVLSSSISSQFCSALLMIAPTLKEGLNLYLKGDLTSEPYIEMTLSIMRDWGAQIEKISSYHYVVGKQHPYRKRSYVVEGDFSSACYFFALAALKKTSIWIRNVSLDSIQADRQFLDILKKMGANYKEQRGGITLKGKNLYAAEVDMKNCPDQIMTFAVVASFAKGISKVFGIESLRYKECDRVKAICEQLKKMEVEVIENNDHLTIIGSDPKACEIKTYNDHRIAMAFSLASARVSGMKIEDHHVVSKTFPMYWEELEKFI